MPEVLTTASVLTCAHGATVLTTASQSALTVDGAPALLVTDLLAATVPACPNTDVSKGQAPCVKVTAVSVGASRLLKVSGTPVALAIAKGTTQATPVLPFAWQVEDPGQTLLRTD
ncbi:hypothetical protein HET69_05030 [Streptomyces sp. CJ_13]|uniref:hypothetical protein n=1 Tax=Streptomyces sp. CJ_13 TaxID=2724943 RepID=UPI001BDBD246|nr:hypothetical protein [Streptomyces sp. CJ_13]MBT1183391.1 hypothetical protein [Streptomyces sp. CJ_13]